MRLFRNHYYKNQKRNGYVEKRSWANSKRSKTWVDEYLISSSEKTPLATDLGFGNHRKLSYQRPKSGWSGHSIIGISRWLHQYTSKQVWLRLLIEFCTIQQPRHVELWTILLRSVSEHLQGGCRRWTVLFLGLVRWAQICNENNKHQQIRRIRLEHANPRRHHCAPVQCRVRWVEVHRIYQHRWCLSKCLWADVRSWRCCCLPAYMCQSPYSFSFSLSHLPLRSIAGANRNQSNMPMNNNIFSGLNEKLAKQVAWVTVAWAASISTTNNRGATHTLASNSFDLAAVIRCFWFALFLPVFDVVRTCTCVLL